MNDAIQQKLIQYMDVMEQAVSQYSSEVVQFGLDITQLGLAVRKVEAVIMIGLAVLCGIVARKLLSIASILDNLHKYKDRLPQEKWDRYYKWSGDSYQVPIGLCGGLAGLFAGLLLFFSIGELLSLWSWIGIWWPEAYLAHEAIQGVIK